ncbi:hypothetical protein Bca4012_052058 [Brassica carinata]|uniref:BnaC02g34540D protein n=4 Tax=Brassica TaxID=3705 RepID=A0A078FN11_BRANA|nr:NAC domain-containing protein 35 isoform X1 [Brassica napus]KAF2599052.1 hypothetical protein F2Q68_00011314 [Brassica cretica]VDD25815.1 unnamed protein product [Brassica oleracea]KAF3536870.1 hypothetical protein F2Q69_00024280 [Brassica cretica]KAH0899415.1 hypothetical protein HID58_048983 [Brassica napus]CAF1919860.1 unnamed protein product [Brassica napus]
MAIVPSTTSIITMMSNQVNNNNEKGIEEDDHRGGHESRLQNDDEADDHDQDMVMPGFRFHPTEEELIEFYLRRKVEGKRFNVELITFLDLYRYDPWELPAMAAIGEKEWYFYVPRDRKYRNGDRPNRVTTSGYWKATGADRMIRSETYRPIGLKKTLVFYSGKAPKGTRSSWIMNEYRLPHHETEKYQKAETSLCRVYKRPGVEDHPSLPRSTSTRHHNHNSSSSSRLAVRQQQQQHLPSSSNHSDNNLNNNNLDKLSTEYSGDGSTITTTNSNSDVTIALANQNIYRPMPFGASNTPIISNQEDDETAIVDDLQRLVNYGQISGGGNINHQYYQIAQQFHNQQLLNANALQSVTAATTAALTPQTQATLAMNMIPAGTIPNNALWEMWNPLVPDGNKDHYTNIPFR